jgi:hypothetical protein
MSSLWNRRDLIPDLKRPVRPFKPLSIQDSFDRGAHSTESFPVENITAKFIIFDDFVDVYFNGEKYTISIEAYQRIRYDKTAKATVESLTTALEQNQYTPEQ